MLVAAIAAFTVVVAPAIAVVGPAATVGPPGEAIQEPWEAFLAPPSSTVGSMLQSAALLTADGEYRELDLGTVASGPILTRQMFAPITGSSPVRGFILTSASVATVSVDGGPPLDTAPAFPAAYGLRAVFYEIPGASVGQFAKTSTRRLALSLVPFDEGGQAIIAEIPPAVPVPKKPALEIRAWESPASPALGVCEIPARRGATFAAQSGSVVSILRATVGQPGRPYVTCAATTYVARSGSAEEKQPLTSFMVLDAAHPGATPAAMPALEAIEGFPSVFASRAPSRGLVARRVPGAWVLVEGGASSDQRLSLLAQLRPSVDLPSSGHRHRAAKHGR